MARPHSFLPPPDSWRISLGLALILCGQSIGWAVRGRLAGDSVNPAYPIAVVLVGFALMLRPRMMVGLRLYAPPLLLASILLLAIVPFVALCLVAPAQLSMFLPYLVFIAGVLSLVAFTPTKCYSRLPEAVMVIAGTSSLLPIVQLATGGGSGLVRLALAGNENTLITGFVGGVAALAAIIVGVGRARNSLLLGLTAGSVFSVGVGAVLLSGTRSVLAMLILLLPFYLLLLRRWMRPAERSAGRRQRSAFWAVIAASAIAAPTIAVAILGTEALEVLIRTSWIRIAGALALVDTSGVGVVDESTSARATMATESWQRMSLGGNGIMAMAFASGNMALYQHNSYLQAFYDLGILGGGLFLFLSLIVPAALIVIRLMAGNLTATDALIILLFVYVQGDQLTHATPYNWQPLLAVGLVYVLVTRIALRSTPPALKG